MENTILWAALFRALRTRKIEWPALAYQESSCTVFVLDAHFAVCNGIRARKGPLALQAQWHLNEKIGYEVFPDLQRALPKWQARRLKAELLLQDTNENTVLEPDLETLFIEKEQVVFAYFALSPGLLLCIPKNKVETYLTHILESFKGVQDLWMHSTKEAFSVKITDKEGGDMQYESKGSKSLASQNKKHRMLIADDDPLIVRALKRSLSGSFVVEVAKGGQGALERLETEKYDVVLCDLSMPDVSGVEVFNRAKTLCPDQLSSFVFMTGGAFTEDASRFLETIDNLVINKPFELANLRQVLQEHAQRDES